MSAKVEVENAKLEFEKDKLEHQLKQEQVLENQRSRLSLTTTLLSQDKTPRTIKQTIDAIFPVHE